MSDLKRRHKPNKKYRAAVRKYNKFPGPGPSMKMWWVDCTCGYYNGCHEKKAAEDLRDQHLEYEAALADLDKK